MPPTNSEMQEEAATPTWMSNPLFAFGLKDHRSPTPSPTTIESNIALSACKGETKQEIEPIPAKAAKAVMKIPDLQVDKRVTPVTPAVHDNLNHAVDFLTGKGALFVEANEDDLRAHAKSRKGRPSLSADEAMASLCNGAVCVSKSHAEKNGNMSPTAIERKFLRQSIASAEVYKTSMPQEMSKSLLQHMEELNNMRVEAFQRYRDTADPIEAQRWGRQYQEISEQIMEAQMELCDASKTVCEFVSEKSDQQRSADADTAAKMPKMGNMAAGPVKHLIMHSNDSNSAAESHDETTNTSVSSSTCGDTTTDDDDEEEFQNNGLSPSALERRFLRMSKSFDEHAQEPLRNGVVHTTALRNGVMCGLEFTSSLSPTAMERKILRNSMSWTDVYQSAKPPRMSAEFLDGVDELNQKVAKDSALKSIEHLSQKRKEAFNKYRESLGNDSEAVEQSLQEYRSISSEIAGQRRSLLESSLPPAFKLRRSISRASPSIAREADIPEEEETTKPADYVRLDMPPKSKVANSTPNKSRPSGLEAALKTPIKTPIRTPKPVSASKPSSGVKQKKNLFSTPKTTVTPSKAVDETTEMKDEMPTHLSGLQVDTSLWKDEPSKIIPNHSTTFLADPNASATFLVDPLAAMDKDTFKDDPHKEESKQPEGQPKLGHLFATPEVDETPPMPQAECEMEPVQLSGLQVNTTEVESGADEARETVEEAQQAQASAETAEEEPPMAEHQGCDVKEVVDATADAEHAQHGSADGSEVSGKQHIVLKHVPAECMARPSMEGRVDIPRNKLGEAAEGPVNLERQSMHESPKHASTFNFFDMLTFFKRQLGFEGKGGQQPQAAEADERPPLKKSWEVTPCEGGAAPAAPSSSEDAIREAKKAITDVLAEASAAPIAAKEPQPAQLHDEESPGEESDAAQLPQATEDAAAEAPKAAAPAAPVAAMPPPSAVQDTPSKSKPQMPPRSGGSVRDLASSFGAKGTPSKAAEPQVQPGSTSKVRDMASSFRKKDEEATASTMRRPSQTDVSDPCFNPGAVFGTPLRATPKKEVGSAKRGNEEIRLTNMSEKVRAVATSFKIKAMAADDSDRTPSKPPRARSASLKATPSKCGGGGNEDTRITNMSNHVREAATNFKEKAFVASSSMPSQQAPVATPNKVKDILAAFNTPQKSATPLQPAQAAKAASSTPVVVKHRLVQDAPEQTKKAEGSPSTTPVVIKTKPIADGERKADTPSKVKDFVCKVETEQPSASANTPSKVKAFVSKVEKIPGGSAANTPSKVRDFAASFTAKIDEQKENTPHKSVIAASPFKKFEQKQQKASTPKQATPKQAPSPLKAPSFDMANAEPEDPTDPRNRKKEWRKKEVFAGVQDVAAGFKRRDAEDQAAEEAAEQERAAAKPYKKARATFQDKIKKAATQVDRSWTTPEKTAIKTPASTGKLPVHSVVDKENMCNSPTAAAPKSASKISTWSRDKALNSAKKKELTKGWYKHGDTEEESKMRREALQETEQMLDEVGDEAVEKTKAWLSNNREEHERVPPGLGMGFRV